MKRWPALLMISMLPLGQVYAQSTWEGRLLVSVDQASALAAAPGGALYVSERDRVTLVDTSGTRLGTAADAASGELFGPRGLDPTNGLVLSVADPGAGRILRFAREGRFLESFRPGSREASSFRRRDAGREAGQAVRPIDVAETGDGRLFVLDEATGTVLVLDRDRRLLRTTGLPSGDDMPVRPVAVSTDGERVYVADAGLPGVVVLDRFGSPETSFGSGLDEPPRAVAVGASGIWVLAGDTLALFSPLGRLSGRWRLKDRPVDVAEAEGRLYVLYPSALHAGPLPEPAP